MNPAKYIANVFSIGCMMAFAVVLYGCGKGELCPDSGDPVVTQFSISPAQKALIPYAANGRDTLMYESEHGDIAVLYGRGVKSSFDTFPVNRSSDPGCPFYDYKKIQTLIYSYKGNSPLLDSIELLVSLKSDETYFAYINTSVDQRFYYGGLEYMSYQENYTDSVIINGNVYKAFGLKSMMDVDKTLFYTRQYGIIQLVSHDHVWTRKF